MLKEEIIQQPEARGASKETISPSSESDAGIFRALLQHWAIARIDTPLDVIARFDEAAKQLIAVGGIIQAAYVAGFLFGSLKGALPLPAWGPLGIVSLFVTLVAMTFCAAMVICLVPEKTHAFSTYELFKQMRSGIEEAKVDSAMNKWCKDIHSLAEKKRLWLHAANLSFVFAFAITLGIVGRFAIDAAKPQEHSRAEHLTGFTGSPTPDATNPKGAQKQLENMRPF